MWIDVNREMEEEGRRNEAVSFFGGGAGKKVFWGILSSLPFSTLLTDFIFQISLITVESFSSYVHNLPKSGGRCEWPRRG